FGGLSLSRVGATLALPGHRTEGLFCVVEEGSMPSRRPQTAAVIPDDSLHESDTGLVALPSGPVPATVDSLTVWVERYRQLAVAGVRSEEVARKIALQLGRFVAFYRDAYGHDRVSACLKRDVVGWQQPLIDQSLAPATVNNHLAALSACTSWVSAHAPRLFPFGDPAKGIGELGLPPLEPRALAEA